MSKTSQFMQDLYEIEALEKALTNQLTGAQAILKNLFNKREALIRGINKQYWDKAQFQLDDYEQKLYDISQEFQEIAPVESIIENLIAE